MIKVLIVDDQELFRESLKVVLGVSPNIQVTDAVPGVAQALESAQCNRPDVVLMDIRMPGMDGVEGTRLFKKRWPDVKVIVLTTFDDDEYVFGALKNGASGYLLKGSSVSKLSESIRIAYDDGAIITPCCGYEGDPTIFPYGAEFFPAQGGQGSSQGHQQKRMADHPDRGQRHVQ